ncbi:AAA family ATPase [Shewanella colwelliana]|uniref:AAA family ATPase n=1 Tax=Shewanella colwelliana TaxID=23 RepID=UPI0022AFD8A8|nr:ATP-binding protein [Shewanella colwelliana]MCZ4337128.1 ATP-binding protein [Shewanella colwelliana]
MILRYGGCNFFCFKEDFEVDLRLNNNCPDDISRGKNCSQIMCVKGANASGKTTALKALALTAFFISNSFHEKTNRKSTIETYFSNSEPTVLYVEFRIDGLDYRYDLTIENGVVLIEKLTRISGKNVVLFSRVGTKLESTMEDYSELETIPQIRSDASLISIASQHEMKCIRNMHNLFDWGVQSNVNDKGFNEFIDTKGLSKFYGENNDLLDFMKNQLARLDTGIVDVEISSLENDAGELIYFPLFSFEIDGEIKKLRLHSQSSGTKRLYKILVYFYIIIKHSDKMPFSSVLIMDELDLHLHSRITPELIKLIEREKNTQLLFTCQNDQIIDEMGKYRTILVNKSENESYSYRLDELPSDLLRNGRPITPHYKKGAIGGVPNIGK